MQIFLYVKFWLCWKAVFPPRLAVVFACGVLWYSWPLLKGKVNRVKNIPKHSGLFGSVSEFALSLRQITPTGISYFLYAVLSSVEMQGKCRTVERKDISIFIPEIQQLKQPAIALSKLLKLKCIQKNFQSWKWKKKKLSHPQRHRKLSQVWVITSALGKYSRKKKENQVNLRWLGMSVDQCGRVI